jgi:hypothetical protein
MMNRLTHTFLKDRQAFPHLDFGQTDSQIEILFWKALGSE